MKVISLVALFATAALWPLMSRATTTTTYFYDELGRLSTTTYAAKTTTYSFDAAGNRTQVLTATTSPHSNAVKAPSRKRAKSAHRKKAAR